ncbi:MAG: ATP-binding cassette domain-containing protein [Shimia sp.]
MGAWNGAKLHLHHAASIRGSVLDVAAMLDTPSMPPTVLCEAGFELSVNDVPDEAFAHNKVANNEALGTFSTVVGVRDATFEVARGEIFCIMGLSGSGKSTLVRHVKSAHRALRRDDPHLGGGCERHGPDSLRQTRAPYRDGFPAHGADVPPLRPREHRL